ncbi:TetR/AcrR family transcriptional regulator [Desulfogranum japonicum]|uniref:TetR/AcrR family transcriptional regulator n=1 Tax=Desulfogranum japonicum TaxID=231447 RepID=UPI0003FB2013|nr:TetR/AcrR family transcriptional regulator [Desulfogranum japonicum]
MAKREDGKETRLRLIHAGCTLFAAKGFRDTKVAEICKMAGANVASVNYYFGDKKSLYCEVWQHALEKLPDPFEIIPADDPPESRLRQYIRILIRSFTDTGDLRTFSRLYLLELVQPTGLIQDAWHDSIQPRRIKLYKLIGELLNDHKDELAIRICELSLINQCRFLVTMKESDIEHMLGRRLDCDFLKLLADKIADFVIAGIHAIHTGNQQRS